MKLTAMLLLAGVAGALAQSAADPPAGTPPEPPKPNILLVFTDDIGWGDMGCYNPKSRIPTPNVDRLAAGGMRFTHAHTPAALCAPTRYAMLSGNYPCRGRVLSGTWGFNVPSQFRPGQKALPLLLKPAGYRCAMFGKAGTGGFWGMKPGAKPAQTPAPLEWGFDYSFLIPRGHQAPPLAFFENGVTTSELVDGRNGQRAADWDHAKVGGSLLEKAVVFLEDHAANHRGRPFFLHFCTDGAHGPYVPAESLAGQRLRGVTKMTEHTDMVHETDILLGALVGALEKLGLRDDTLVFYTSDNGGLPFERDQGHDAVAGLRGKKGFIFEGGHRVPFVAAWPGRVPAGAVRNQPVGTHDIVATALELAGVEKPAGQALDSVSLAPVLLGSRDDSRPVRDWLLVQSSPGRGPFNDGGARAGGGTPPRQARSGGELAFALYRGDWKLVLYRDGRPAALYDLATDLAEEHNRIDDPELARRVGEMAAEFRRIRPVAEDPGPADRRRPRRPASS